MVRAKCPPRSHLKSGLAKKCQGKMSPGQYVPQEVRAKCLPAGQGKMSPKIETREKSGQFVPQGNMSSGQFVPQPQESTSISSNHNIFIKILSIFSNYKIKIRYTDFAEEFILQESASPFFLFFSFQHVHFPQFSIHSHHYNQQAL